MHYSAKFVLHFIDFRDCRCGWVDFEPNRWILTCVTYLWSGCILNIAGFLPRWNPSSKLEFFNPRCPLWSGGWQLPSTFRMGLCVNLVELFASTRLLHCQVCNPRVKIVTVVCRCFCLHCYFLSRCLLFEPSHWGVISINLQLDSGLEFLLG